MTWYVPIQRLNGRSEFLNLVEKLNVNGFGDRVEYYPGGWADNIVQLSTPHLKFENEDDALAYVLAFGGELSRTVPVNANYVGS